MSISDETTTTERTWIDRIFMLDVHSPLLLKAQYEAAISKSPIYFASLMACCSFIIYCYWGVAPLWLGFIAPLIIYPVCGLWISAWYVLWRGETSHAVIVRRMRHICMSSMLFAAALAVWPTVLTFYGNQDTFIVSVVYFSMGTLCGLVCMTHFRGAIIVVMATCPPLYASMVYFQYKTEVLPLAAIFIILVGVSAWMLLRYCSDFSALTLSQSQMAHQRNELAALSEENDRMANLDALTGLANRRRFFSDMAKRQTDNELAFAIGILDLDGFKPVNDTYGHVLGDEVLKVLAQRLLVICEGRADVYRLGGDEFGIILPGARSSEELSGVADVILDAVRLPIAVNGLQVNLGCTLGYARYPESASTTAQLYERADYALYYAKRNGRGRAVVFNADHEREIREHSIMETTLKSCDMEKEFYLLFQPIVDARSNRTLAFECLARWASPELGQVSPAVFVRVAEQAGVITTLTPVLFAKALAAATAWPEHVRMTFNLSAFDICLPGQAGVLNALVAGSGIAPERIDFELTETAITQNFELARENMRLLREAGSNIALDDFGTGYSSLSHIHRLPLDKIKIDRSFVQDVESNQTSHKIIKSLSALCLDMGLECVAEGVESGVQVRTLAGIGCNMIQGYYFARPMPADEIDGFLARTLPVSSDQPEAVELA